MHYDYEWDIEKAHANLRKHGVDFADATVVLEDEQALTIEDENSRARPLRENGSGMRKVEEGNDESRIRF